MGCKTRGEGSTLVIPQNGYLFFVVSPWLAARFFLKHESLMGFLNHLHIQRVSGLWCKVQTLNFVWVVCSSALSSSSSDQLSGVATSSCFFP